ncbi:class E sortase [Streptomyces specialis]|uniref:class E sortase n=1 Tax=Streptomyces specialis TaxID=498367 RepID=UPI000AC5B5A2|nr:class E sortase [Streptomyces specialis]
MTTGWGSDDDAYRAAVEGLQDPLTDPLPGPPAPADPETIGLRRPDRFPAPADGGRAARRRAAQAPGGTGASAPPDGGRAARRRAAQGPRESAAERTAALPSIDGESGPEGGRAARRRAARAPGGTAASVPPDGGRAARRRAASAPPSTSAGSTGPTGPGGGRAARRKAGAAAPAAPAEEPPLTGGRAARRKAAKAAAKAAKQTGTAISNVIGELFITTGVLLLLFVVYQLWWTNVEARAHANNEADSLQEQWENAEPGEDDRDPGAFTPGEGFAILYLPTLDVRVPIAESVDPAEVLDNGMVGHYTEEDRLPTAMPWDEEGNFGLAGHRNTHGEPFRYINRLEPGDPIVVETRDTYYTYEMTSRLDSTSPSNIAVLDPVPDQGGFTEPGRYITLTTCTPEFTSTYRMIVWGQMTEERPRSEGKPDALVN